MAAVANIVLADAQATPVSHTFIPLGPDQKGVWWFEDQTGIAPIGYNRISVELVRASTAKSGQSAGDSTSKVRLGIHTPKMEVMGNSASGLTPPPTVAYVPKVFLEYLISDRATAQDRKDLRKFAQFLQADAQIVDMVENLRSIY